MNSIERAPEAPGDFNEIRRDVAERLFRDPSYTVFDAMIEMSTAAEEHINTLATQFPGPKLWVAGSLGRREMLPNSDIDLFVIHDDEDYTESAIRVEGVDKFEIGQVSSSRLRGLLRYSIVEAHQFTDGRMAGQVPTPDVEEMILEECTPDHQLATTISEYFFYRYFDFPNKATTMGSNIKYSAGASRETMFFNLVSRINTGRLPAVRGNDPELLEALLDAEERYDLRAPFESINLLFTVKNAAISVSDMQNDVRKRYASPESLAAIYDFGKEKFQAWGIKDERHFIETYSAARQELEQTVDTMMNKMLSVHPASESFEKVLRASPEELPELCLALVTDESDYPHSVATFSTWYATTGRVNADYIEKITDELIKQPLDRSWGALMAVACCPYMPDSRLSTLADWLYEHEKGAYLMKLITRNTNASAETKKKALGYYKEKLIVV